MESAKGPEQKRLFLHVGLPKTGSTALQVWCQRNRDVLARHGISYPTPSPDDPVPKHQFVVKALRTGDFSAVRAAMAEQPHTGLMLSSEGISNHFYHFPKAHVDAFRALIADYRITILLVLRDRERWITSLWKQVVINPKGNPVSREDFGRSAWIARLADFETLKRDLVEGLGAAEICAPYLEEGWKAPLLELLGIDGAEMREDPSRANESISSDLYEMIRQVNEESRQDPNVRAATLALLQKACQTNHDILMEYAEKHESPQQLSGVTAILDRIEPQNEEQERILELARAECSRIREVRQAAWADPSRRARKHRERMGVNPNGMTGYIHIGAPKCGSTALQSVISSNIDRLAAAGIHAPQSQTFANELAHRFAVGWQNPKALRQALAEEGSAFHPDEGDILLSSEAYLVVARNPENLDKLCDLFQKDALHVLGIVRDPASMLESTWFQWMRTYRKFPKVKEAMAQYSLYFEEYLQSDWFEVINANWQAWKAHPNVKSFKEVRLGLDPFDPVAVLSDFLERDLELEAKKRETNESMNGVTFRILKEWRKYPMNHYGDFVAKLDKSLREQGYGEYRFLSPSVARRVNLSAKDLPLFADFAELERTTPAAQDMPKDEFNALLEASKEIARPFLKNPGSDKV